MAEPGTANRFLAGGGEMGRRVLAFDWAKTPLGALETWPQNLKTTVGIMLTSRFAMWMLWGRELTFLCNDTYLPILGVKGDWALGSRSDKVWAEIWKDIGPRIDTVLCEGTATWDEALMLILERAGFAEETYHTFSYSPLAGEDGSIAGMLCVVTEETERVLSERRLGTLRELAAEQLNTNTVERAVAAIERGLAADARDLPFTALYLIEADDRRARFVGGTGLPAGHRLARDAADGDEESWPVAQIIARNTKIVVNDLQSRFGEIPSRPWTMPPSRAIVAPINLQAQGRPAGFLVAGLNPFRAFDNAYASFIDLIAGQIAAGLSSARAYESELKRVEALAELDRAKTVFFSNVSHEFRTPLTLQLAPLQDALEDTVRPLDAIHRERIETAHRNSLRLLKLVNTLLDFARIEAGRAEATFTPVDLAAFTAELASNFRSVCEQAGLDLVVDCPPLAEPVHIDRDMWEKIVLNLMSNAFKFTLQGSITVRVTQDGRAACLTVQDTGLGIPERELPNLFQRFHRVRGAAGRSHEGSGIGLALVQELVKLHSGSIAVESGEGRGSTFRVTVPLGTAHLDQERIETAVDVSVSGSTARASYIEEALQWLPGAAATTTPALDMAGADPVLTQPGRASGRRGRVLVADDNVDMRNYLARLLEPFFDVRTVSDGEAAFEAAVEQSPDLILTDVMMPKLDGLELLRRVREDVKLRATSVILVSARAGEEARSEGLRAGADDYLVKPFNARELVLRLESAITLARLRRDTIENEVELRTQASVARDQLAGVLAAVTDQFFALDRDWRYTLINDRVTEVTGRTRDEMIGRPIWELFPELAGSPFEHELRRAVAEHRSISFEYFYEPLGLWFSNNIYPTAEGVAVLATDVTLRKEIEGSLVARETELARVQRIGRIGGLEIDLVNGYMGRRSPEYRALHGLPDNVVSEGHVGWLERVHPDDRAAAEATLSAAISGAGSEYRSEYRIVRPIDGLTRWIAVKGEIERDPHGRPVRILGAHIDVTERRLIEEAARANEHRARLALDVAELGTWSWDAAADLVTADPRCREICGLGPQNELRLATITTRIHASDWLRIKGALGAALHPKGNGLYAEEFRIVLETGEERWVIARGQTVFAGEGDGRRPGIMLGTVLDVTARRRAEEALRNLNSTLEHRVAERTRELSAANRQLLSQFEERERVEATLRQMQRLEAVGQLTAGVAHDFNNLLTIILGAVRFFEKLASTPDQRRRIELTRQAAERGAKLTAQLLAFSRRQKLEPEALNLNDAVAGMVDLLRSTMGGAIRVETVSRDGVWPAFADPTQVELVILNLAINARDAMPAGGSLVVETANRCLTEPGARPEEPGPGDYVAISVTDTGSGMPEHVLARAFEPFFTTKDVGKGSGLGLAQVYGFAKQSGGGVKLASTSGKGTTVTVYLPRAHEAEVRKVSTIARRAELGRDQSATRPVILLVDDDSGVREITGGLLNDLGYSVIATGSGGAALEALDRTEHVDLLLLDYAMPGMTGVEVAREAGQRRPGVPVLFITGYADAAALREVGQASIVQKPFDEHDLASKIEAAIGKRAPRSATVVPLRRR